MGIYAITGGTKGIGAKTKALLEEAGHKVINIDVNGGEICADLGTREGREYVLGELHTRCSDGLDGLILNAGIASGKSFSRVISVNYFGAVTIAEGAYDLLKMKKGCCVVTVSASNAYMTRTPLYVDELLVNCGDEARIGRLVDTFDPREVDIAMYCSTKIGLTRWVRRTAPSWAAKGVNLNAVAPGGVNTTIMAGATGLKADMSLAKSLPMPTAYWESRLLEPDEVAGALAFLALLPAKGISGEILFCDGGTSSLLHSDSFY